MCTKDGLAPPKKTVAARRTSSEGQPRDKVNYSHVCVIPETRGQKKKEKRKGKSERKSEKKWA